MAAKCNNVLSSRVGILMFVLACCAGSVQADLYYYGGVEVDIDWEVDDFLFIQDATVNLYEPAWIKYGVWVENGSVLNIHGGRIDYVLDIGISTQAPLNTLPNAEVTVFGRDFTVNGLPVDPGTPELYLNYEELGGVYASGTAFSFVVYGSQQGTLYMKVKLVWLDLTPRIEVSPLVVEFGDVEVGQARTAAVTVANLGNGALTLEAIAVEQDGETDFGFIPLEQFPVTIAPDGAIEVEAVFAPSMEGPFEAYLLIFSDDPDKPYVEVLLTGTGVVEEEEPELTIHEKIDLICAFYRAGLKDGTIVGTGPGKSGDARAAVIGLSLSLARDLIRSGYVRLALVPLESVSAKTSGAGWPRDFVAGASVADLNAMVKDLIDDIRDEYPRKPCKYQWGKWKK